MVILRQWKPETHLIFKCFSNIAEIAIVLLDKNKNLGYILQYLAILASPRKKLQFFSITFKFYTIKEGAAERYYQLLEKKIDKQLQMLINGTLIITILQ
jgi:hypothetical protein